MSDAEFEKIKDQAKIIDGLVEDHLVNERKFRRRLRRVLFALSVSIILLAAGFIQNAIRLQENNEQLRNTVYHDCLSQQENRKVARTLIQLRVQQEPNNPLRGNYDALLKDLPIKSCKK